MRYRDGYRSNGEVYDTTITYMYTIELAKIQIITNFVFHQDVSSPTSMYFLRRCLKVFVLGRKFSHPKKKIIKTLTTFLFNLNTYLVYLVNSRSDSLMV